MNWKRNSIILLLAGVVIAACFLWPKGRALTSDDTGEVKVEAITVGANRYGYQILKGGRIIILQPYVPAVREKSYFSSPEDAIRVGRFVVKRMEDGKDFTITIDDLQQLGVRFFSD